MSFYSRITLFSLAVALLTGVLIWRGPQAGDVIAVARAPESDAVPAGSSIRVTFSRPVDRRSAEQNFVLTPALPGRFFWQDQTMTFRPGRPLAPETVYRVSIGPALRDSRGRANATPIDWSFKTRSARILALKVAPDGGGALWSVAPDGSAAREIYVAAGISAVAPAPDGLQVLVLEPRGPQRNALMLLNLEDGTARPLVDDPESSVSGPAWSPNGDLIAIERRKLLDNALGQPRIWLAQPDGTSLGPLYGGDDVNFAPVWSPDGSRVAFLDGLSQAIGIYDSFSDKRRVLAASSAEPVNWLPDGAALIYSGVDQTDGSATVQIRRVNLDRDRVQNLTEGSAAASNPAVSPDGAWLAFVRRASDGPGSTLWIMRTDGSEQRQLTSPGAYQDSLPVWSPDGRRISFIRNSIGAALESAAWVIDLEGSAPRQVLDGAVQATWIP